MFTVIFVNQRAEQQRKNYQFLFQPFIDADEMCFCPWLPDGESIESAVPGLDRILKGKKEWRAIVLHMDSVDEPKEQSSETDEMDEEEENCKFTASERNPFDYTHIDNNPMPHNSDIPLIRLTHMLAGYEYSTIREYEEVYEYFNDELDEKRVIPKESIDRFYQIQKHLDEVRIRFKKEKPLDERNSDEEFDDNADNNDDDILNQHYLFASYCNEKTGNTVRISFDLLIKLLKFQNLVFQYDNRYLYAADETSEPEIVTKDCLYRTCQYHGDDCRVSIFQQECIEYFLLHRIEYQLIHQQADGDEVLDEENLYIEYVDERLKKTCRVLLNDWYRTERLFKLKSKSGLRLVYLDGTDERELIRTSVFIDNRQVKSTRPIHFSLDELENYHKLGAIREESEIHYTRDIKGESGTQTVELDKHALLMESVDSGMAMSDRFSMNSIEMFRLLQNNKTALIFSYLPESKRYAPQEQGISIDNVPDYLSKDDILDTEQTSGVELKALDSDVSQFGNSYIDAQSIRTKVMGAEDVQYASETTPNENQDYIEFDRNAICLELPVADASVQISLEELFEIEDIFLRRDELKLTHRAVLHDSKQIQKQKELNKQYQFSDNRPLELLLFATRHKSETDEKQTFNKAWNSVFDTERSRFWEFNHYPVNCRFLYMDLISSRNSRFDQDMLKYWISVLLMARQGTGSLKAYNLYRITLDLNENSLNFAINRQINMLQAAFKNLKQELLCAEDYTFKPNEVLFTEEKVTVNFDRDEALDILQRETRSAFSSGDRDADLKELSDSSHKITKEKMLSLKTGNKQRVLDNAVKLIRQRSFEFANEEYLLDDYQIKELQAQKTDYERKLLNNGIYSPEEFEELMKKAEIENKKKLEAANKAREENEKTKMTWDVVKTVFWVALGLIIVGNGTYIVQSAMQSSVFSENFWNGFIAVVVTIVIILIAGGCAYYVFRQYSKEIEHRENEFKNTVSTVQKSDEPIEKQYGDFYSNLLTYLKLQAMYLGMDARKKNDIAARRRLLEYSRAIQYALERDEKWLRLFGLERIAVKKVYSDGFQEAPVKNPMFYFETAMEDEVVRLNEHEQMNTAYSFIDHVWIERDYLLDDCEDN